MLEFKLDEANKKVTSMGSVQKFGGEYFIGGGSANYMLEVNYGTGVKIKEFLGSEASYRSFSYPLKAN